MDSIIANHEWMTLLLLIIIILLLLDLVLGDNNGH